MCTKVEWVLSRGRGIREEATRRVTEKLKGAESRHWTTGDRRVQGARE